ncbi:hypothetical protein MLD52_01610 [Puniceicoccaceae bacterium K14]|nr:hypothetical protein [Puniceicoccaceae bacterium K14]
MFLFFIGHEQNSVLRVFSEVESEYLEALKVEPRVTCIQKYDLSKLYLDESNFIQNLQRQFRVDATLLVNGDVAIPMLLKMNRDGSQKFFGRTVGLFINSEWVHNDGADVSALPLKTVSYRSFFRQVAEGESVLDGVVVTDDVLACSFTDSSPVCRHLPDIILPEKNPIARDSGEPSKVKALVDHFVERNVGKHLIFFFGDLEKRKGFDFLLRFCSENQNTILLRVGRTKPGYSPGGMDDVSRKSRLVIEDRILEIDAFIDDIKLIDYFFSLAKFVPLPYDRFLRTSGLMLEAVSRGLPVVVPDAGLMSVRVKQYGLGVTYKSGSYEDFSTAMSHIMDTNMDYSRRLSRYATAFSESVIEKTMKWAVNAKTPEAFRAVAGMLKPKEGDEIALRKELVCHTWNCRNTKRKLALSRFLAVATSMRVAVFGGGAYARWLETMTEARDDLQIVALLDNRPDPNTCLWGLKAELVSTFKLEGIGAIVLATEVFTSEMRADCWRYFGSAANIVSLN